VSDDLGLLLTIAGCGLTTLALRLSFVIGGSQFKPGRRIRAVLAYVPPAVLAALIAPEILLRHGQIDAGLDNPRLLAGALAVAVAFFTRSVLATIACGLLALWAVQRLI
jgi:branched-subunit amino acid transport protein